MSMRSWGIATLAVVLIPARAAEPCQNAQTYRPCELRFELDPSEFQTHPNPYASIELEAEFRSPGMKTYLMPGFWDGDRSLVIRFSPTRAGRWDYRLRSNLARLNGLMGSFVASDSGSPGFVRVANVHHWAYDADPIRPKPHLWMGDTCYALAVLDRSLFEQLVQTRASQGFNHIRGYLLGQAGNEVPAYQGAQQPNLEYFRELDSRIRFLNDKGITADLILASDPGQLIRLFPTWSDRARYLRYVVARYAAMNVTWQLVEAYEDYAGARNLLRELGQLLRKLDPYQHPRSTGTKASSGPLAGDEWMDYLVHRTADDALQAIEHQLYGLPQVNIGFGCEDPSGGGAGQRVSTDDFRKRLWTATMNGQYPTYCHARIGAQASSSFDPSDLQAPGAQQMSHWFKFFSNTRHWELEPYFDVEGGRALALPGVEYIVYLETPGPVEVVTEKKSYRVYWFNPITGELIREKREYRGAHFTGKPPTLTQDWVLHLSRDEQKRSMLERWYFESRPVLLQEVEFDPSRVPYQIEEPSQAELRVSELVQYRAKLLRETRATRAMRYVWVGEVTPGDAGYYVLGTGPEGQFTLPKQIIPSLPATLTLRLFGMNTLGKVYSISRVYRLVP